VIHITLKGQQSASNFNNNNEILSSSGDRGREEDKYERVKG